MTAYGQDPSFAVRGRLTFERPGSPINPDIRQSSAVRSTLGS